jgi:hypothetical protein
VVVEEFPKLPGARRTGATKRYIAGIITPACPAYEHALEGEQDDIDAASRPLLGGCTAPPHLCRHAVLQLIP